MSIIFRFGSHSQNPFQYFHHQKIIKYLSSVIIFTFKKSEYKFIQKNFRSIKYQMKLNRRLISMIEIKFDTNAPNCENAF